MNTVPDLRRAALLAALLGAAVASIVAADEAKQQPPPAAAHPATALPTKVDPKTGRTVVVITNADLERMYGKSTVPVSAAGVPAPGGVAEAASAAKAATPAGPERAAAVEAELARLRQNAQRMLNPYLGRPNMTDEEREAVKGVGAAKRYEMNQQRITELEAELARLRQAAAPAPPPPGN